MFFGSLGRSNHAPIGVDFGVSRLKVMQLEPAESAGPGRLVAAACRATPPELIDRPVERLAFQTEALNEVIRRGPFRGRRAVCTIPAAHTVVQHLQMQKDGARSTDAAIGEEIRRITGHDPHQFIARHREVCEVTRGGTKRTETICLAMPRDAVLAYMKALRSCRLEAVGVHAEHHALVRGVQALAGQAEGATLIIDLGHGMTKVAVAHGADLVLAKALPIGERQLCGEAGTPARAPGARPPRDGLKGRLAALGEADTATMTALLDEPTGAAPALPGEVDGLADEVAQCLRYHRALFPDRPISRAVFTGGGACRIDVCRRISRAAGVPAQIADPFSALGTVSAGALDGVRTDGPEPGWAVALGLCSTPTDV